MIYVSLVAQNDADMVGLVLWKLRKVFQEFPREYQILAVDDGSIDGTAEILDTYQRALPMTVLPSASRRGLAPSLEVLLREALTRSDRHKRDCVAVIPADFSVSPAVVPELLRRFESGADVVVAEIAGAARPWTMRVLARIAPWLLRPGVSVPGVRDLLSGTCVIRLVSLRNVIRDGSGPFLISEGIAAHAELVARTASEARQVASVQWSGPRGSAVHGGLRTAAALAIRLFRAGRTVPAAGQTVVVERS